MNQYTSETLLEADRVLQKFKYVSIDWKRLRIIACKNAIRLFALPPWDFPGCQPKSHRAFPSHCFMWNVINFCYDTAVNGRLVKFIVENNDKPLAGAYAMERCFYRLFGDDPIDPAALLFHIGTPAKFREVFRGVNEMPLLEERFEFLLEACRVLDERFGGDVMGLIKEADYRAFGTEARPGIVELLVKWFPQAFGQDWFRDESRFFSLEGKTFHFLKRSQLFALMYHDRAVASGGALQPLRDAEEIGPIADYALPKSYAAEGVLFYREDLADHIARALPIPRHSQPEVEIRLAFMLAHAEELRLINELRADRGLCPIHVGHLDYYRWERGRSNEGLNHHLTYTTDY